MWAETHTRAKQQQPSWKIPTFHLLCMRWPCHHQRSCARVYSGPTLCFGFTGLYWLPPELHGLTSGLVTVSPDFIGCHQNCIGYHGSDTQPD